jgi:hypothetical protein
MMEAHFLALEAAAHATQNVWATPMCWRVNYMRQRLFQFKILF